MQDELMIANDVTLEVTPEEEDVHAFMVDGRKLRLRIKAVDPMIIMKARDAVKPPSRPTYQTKTATGKVETFPMDEESAADPATPSGKARWESYQEEKQDALLRQGLSVMRAWFYYGAEWLDPMPDWDWIEEQQALEIEVPSHTNPRIDEKLKKAHYLATKLGSKERERLMSLISRKGGVSEEAIAEAEAAFRGEVHSGQAGA